MSDLDESIKKKFSTPEITPVFLTNDVEDSRAGEVIAGRVYISDTFARESLSALSNGSSKKSFESDSEILEGPIFFSGLVNSLSISGKATLLISGSIVIEIHSTEENAVLNFNALKEIENHRFIKYQINGHVGPIDSVLIKNFVITSKTASTATPAVIRSGVAESVTISKQNQESRELRLKLVGATFSPDSVTAYESESHYEYRLDTTTIELPNIRFILFEDAEDKSVINLKVDQPHLWQSWEQKFIRALEVANRSRVGIISIRALDNLGNQVSTTWRSCSRIRQMRRQIVPLIDDTYTGLGSFKNFITTYLTKPNISADLEFAFLSTIEMHQVDVTEGRLAFMKSIFLRLVRSVKKQHELHSSFSHAIGILIAFYRMDRSWAKLGPELDKAELSSVEEPLKTYRAIMAGAEFIQCCLLKDLGWTQTVTSILNPNTGITADSMFPGL